MNYEVQIVGNLGGAPEQMGETQDRQPIVRFNVARNFSYIDPATQQRVKRDPEWFQVSCFAKLGARAKASLKKGDLVLVSGKIRSRTYQSSSGEKRTAFEIIAQEVLRVERLPTVASPGQELGNESDEPEDFSGSGDDAALSERDS